MCDTSSTDAQHECGCGCGEHDHTHGEGHECRGHQLAEEMKRRPVMKSVPFDAGLLMYQITCLDEVTSISGELELEIGETVSASCFNNALLSVGSDVRKLGGAVAQLETSAQYDGGEMSAALNEAGSFEVKAIGGQLEQFDEDTVIGFSIVAQGVESKDLEEALSVRIEQIL